MLPVAIDLNRRVEAGLKRVAESGLHRAADPEVEGQPDNTSAVLPRNERRVVGRAVVDHEDLDLRVEGFQLVDDVAHRVLLVEGRHDGEGPQLRPLRRCGSRCEVGGLRHAARF